MVVEKNKTQEAQLYEFELSSTLSSLDDLKLDVLYGPIKKIREQLKIIEITLSAQKEKK